MTSLRGLKSSLRVVRGLKAEMKVLRAEWSGWEPRHVRCSREGSGRAVREAAEIQWAEKLRAKAAARR